VDIPWLAKEGAVLGNAPGTPKRPLVAGGGGAIGSNLVVLLANSPGCERVRVLDMRPPSAEVLAGIEDKVEFVEFRFGSGSFERLVDAVRNIDCCFVLFTAHPMLATLEEFIATNVQGVESITKACAEAGVSRIVFSSSIAVSNMYVESFNQVESDPLPPLESYELPYDVTKRQGEEIVLAANSKDGKLRTCACRFGGVLLHPRDFFFAYVWPIIPGVCMGPLAKPVDWMDGRDVSRALLMAAQALQVRPEGVAGEAFRTTSCGTPWCSGKVARVVAEVLRYPFIPIPPLLTRVTCAVLGAHFHAKRLLGCRVPGMPLHKVISTSFYQKTFDNSKAQKRLGFFPKISVPEAVERVVDLWVLETGARRGPFLGLFSLSLLSLAASGAALAALARWQRR